MVLRRAAFLSSRLEITQEVKLKAMRHIRDDKAKNQMVKLALLAFAQRKSGATRLSGLGGWMSLKLRPIVEALHSRKLREDMSGELKVLADQGNLEGMFNLISGSDYFSRDHEGFVEAQNAYAIYDNELKNIKIRHGLSMNQNVQYQYGLYLSKIIGVVIFVATLIIMMPKNVI